MKTIVKTTKPAARHGYSSGKQLIERRRLEAVTERTAIEVMRQRLRFSPHEMFGILLRSDLTIAQLRDTNSVIDLEQFRASPGVQ